MNRWDLKSVAFVILLTAGLSACNNLPDKRTVTTENQTENAQIENTPRSANWKVPASWQQGVVSRSWQHFTFPGKTPTVYKIDQVDGRDAIWANSQSTSSAIRSDVNIEVNQIGRLKFS